MPLKERESLSSPPYFENTTPLPENRKRVGGLLITFVGLVLWRCEKCSNFTIAFHSLKIVVFIRYDTICTSACALAIFNP